MTRTRPPLLPAIRGLALALLGVVILQPQHTLASETETKAKTEPKLQVATFALG